MHMITFNNAMCDTGHLQICSLTHSEHRHPQGYKINVTCSLTNCRKSTLVSILCSPICILWVQLTKFMWYLHVKYVQICVYMCICRPKMHLICIIMHVLYYKCIDIHMNNIYT